jgi:microtubule-associated protein-like 6
MQVFGLEWNGYEISQFATYGKKHVKVWKQAGAAGSWVGTQLSFGKLPLQNVTAASWLPPSGSRGDSLLLAGMADGQVYVFKVGRCWLP